MRQRLNHLPCSTVVQFKTVMLLVIDKLILQLFITLFCHVTRRRYFMWLISWLQSSFKTPTCHIMIPISLHNHHFIRHFFHSSSYRLKILIHIRMNLPTKIGFRFCFWYEVFITEWICPDTRVWNMDVAYNV